MMSRSAAQASHAWSTSCRENTLQRRLLTVQPLFVALVKHSIELHQVCLRPAFCSGVKHRVRQVQRSSAAIKLLAGERTFARFS